MNLVICFCNDFGFFFVRESLVARRLLLEVFQLIDGIICRELARLETQVDLLGVLLVLVNLPGLLCLGFHFGLAALHAAVAFLVERVYLDALSAIVVGVIIDEASVAECLLLVCREDIERRTETVICLFCRRNGAIWDREKRILLLWRSR